jgi:succinate-semialdehyde dehydrogenase / glutarate-semialdehyde dehydrogenase
MQTDFNLLINGSSRAGSTGDWVPVLNPATEETIGRVAYASSEDLSETIAAASRGLREWQSVAAWERGRRLKKAADFLRADVETAALTLTREQGKPLAEARDEVERSADFLEWGGEQARRISDRVVPGRLAGSRIEIQSHPIGVVAAFTPWNFPMALAAKKFAEALGAGCSIICKTSQGTPGSVLVMAKALLEAGVTPSALAVIFGQAEEVASRLITARETAKVTFTGSIPIGKRLAAAAGAVIKPVTMELGGMPLSSCAGMLTRNTRRTCLRGRSSPMQDRFACARHASSWRRVFGNALRPDSSRMRRPCALATAQISRLRWGHWRVRVASRQSRGLSKTHGRGGRRF